MMMVETAVIELSRLQFAATAMFHFLFVPLTLGLGFILAIMESVYVLTGKVIYKDMTRFWGKLYTINFAMGVATGITLEFQFGTNWAYYAHYVGDIFGVPLAIEGITAFFLESTLLGVFLFGWDRLSRPAHLAVTWLLALAANLSGLWILIANAWMNYPVGAQFNPDTMRMEVTNLYDVFFSPVAQVKFVHTVAAGYVTGAIFVLSISAYYLLQKRNRAFARRSFAVAAGFGLASVLSVIVLGDESGYSLGEGQETKLALIESEWETHPAPAAFTVIGLPNQQERRTDYALRIPYALGLIATRSLDTPVRGLDSLMDEKVEKMRQGITAYHALETYQKTQDPSAEQRQHLQALSPYLGYGLLVKRYHPKLDNVTDAQLLDVAWKSLPYVAPIFWGFRIMVGSAMIMLAVMLWAFWSNIRYGRLYEQRKLLWACVLCFPLPWVACEMGWLVAEYGRQPWVIVGVLPTAMATSSSTVTQVATSLIALCLLYSALFVIEVYLMLRAIRKGPALLATGRYDGESSHA